MKDLLSMAAQHGICSIPRCKNRTYDSSLCYQHLSIYNKNGSVTPGESRSIFDPNDFIVNGDICEIVIRNKIGTETCKTIVDIGDIEMCKRHKWYLNSTGYATTKLNGQNHFMHQLILCAKNIDHINRDRLDNRKCNLRKCTVSQNLHNRGAQSNGKSKYKGVWKQAGHKKWSAAVKFGDKRYWCGAHEIESDAAIAYNKKAKEVAGEFAYLNEI